MAVAVQVLGALLLVAAVALWSWPVALGLAGVLLIAGGMVVEFHDASGAVEEWPR